MKLAHPLMERIVDFEENSINTLVIENKTFFREIIEELNNQILGQKGSFILSDKNKEINFGKNIYMIMDYYNLDINSTRFKKIIEKSLEDIASSSNHIDTNGIIEKLGRVIELISIDYEFPINYKNIEIIDLIKLFKPELELEGEFLERILQIIRFLSLELKICVIILVNVRSYLDLIDLEKLQYQCMLEDLNLLTIENEIEERTIYEKLFIIDRDLCEI